MILLCRSAFTGSRGRMVFVAALALSACDRPAFIMPTTVASAPLEVVAVPTSLSATPSSGVTYELNGAVLEYDWRTSFSAVIRAPDDQTAVAVVGQTLVLRQTTADIVVVPPPGLVEHYEFDTAPHNNRVETGTEMSIDYEVWYTLPNEGREARIQVDLTFVDDDAVTIVRSVTIPVR